MVAMKLPVVEDVTVVGVVTILPSSLMVMVALGAKFTPLIVTTVPAGPDVGERVMADATTVKVALAVFMSSCADTV